MAKIGHSTCNVSRTASRSRWQSEPASLASASPPVLAYGISSRMPLIGQNGLRSRAIRRQR